MQSFIVERTIPPVFQPADPADVALHCRWATDAYREVGGIWFGGAVVEDRMFSLVAAEGIDNLRRYCSLLRIPDTDVMLRRVVQFLGPSLAGPRP